MLEQTRSLPRPPRSISLIAGIALTLVAIWPSFALATLVFVLQGLIDVAPLVVPGILLAAWLIASGADAHIALTIEGKALPSIVAASAIGAVTPVCGVTVLPLMAGLLAAGMPLAPIMAFWLSSPVTDPAMLATTAATLGWTFALGKTLAAFGLGLLGGAGTSLVAQRPWARQALRTNRLTGRLDMACCKTAKTFQPRIWQDSERRHTFRAQALATARLILICLTPAFAAEFALNTAITPGALAAYLGEDAWWSIPAAVFVGAPAYIDGYAALPLTRALIDNGMSQGAAMAFLVSGGVVSIWGALAIFPVLKLKPFLLYLAFAIIGSLIAGYVFDWVV